MAKTEQPTATPWRASRTQFRAIVDSNGNKIADVAVAKHLIDGVTPEANRKFIILAVNKHAALVKALEATFIALGRAGGNMIDSPFRKDWEAARDALVMVGCHLYPHQHIAKESINANPSATIDIPANFGKAGAA